MKALHNLVSDKVYSDFSRAQAIAVRNLQNMRSRVNGVSSNQYLDMWEESLSSPEKIVHLCRLDSDEGDSLRQLSPFAGLLTMQERIKAIRSINNET